MEVNSAKYYCFAVSSHLYAASESCEAPEHLILYSVGTMLYSNSNISETPLRR